MEEYMTLRGESFGVSFFHNTKPSSVGGTKKLYWRRVYMNYSNLI